MMRLLSLLLVGALVVLGAGCASSRSGEVYSRDEARRVQTVQMGRVIYVKEVLIEGTKSKIGAGVGAVAGGISAAGSGRGTGDKVAGVLGAAVGGLAGAAVEEGITRRKGLEIMVELDSGKTLVVVQEADQAIAANDRVRLIRSPNGTTRVSH